jgi:hypothetical protein
VHGGQRVQVLQTRHSHEASRRTQLFFLFLIGLNLLLQGLPASSGLCRRGRDVLLLVEQLGLLVEIGGMALNATAACSSEIPRAMRTALSACRRKFTASTVHYPYLSRSAPLFNVFVRKQAVSNQAAGTRPTTAAPRMNSTV